MGSTASIIIEQQQSRRRGRLGCYLKLLVGIVALVLLFHYVIRPVFESGFGMADTRPVPGEAAHFEPFVALPGIFEYAGAGAELVSIDLRYVRSDGTMDLTAESYRPRAEYTFVRPAAPPADAPPIGAGGSVSGQWYERVTIEAYQPGQWRHVTTISGGVSTEYSYMNQGMERDIDSPISSKPPVIARPECSLAEMWEAAKKQDAPQDAVATITYNAQGYDFRISALSISLQFGTDCRLRN
ncbi:MAG: hypothetical protein H6671_08835 [Anaerolineaceae bacterium]|nr:hypothetical protein [Anaerolineaceae bacterium]